MMAMCVCSLASCSDDDDDNDGNGSSGSSIVGTWRYDDSDECYELMTFKAGGTGSYTVYEYYDSEWHGTETMSFTYTTADGILTITYADGDVESGPYLIKDGKLYPGGEVDDEYFYYRV